jgi:ribosomal protein S18 acetylase RimI-like enzyme
MPRRAPSTSPADIVAYHPSDQPDIEAFFAEVWRDSRFPFDPKRAHSDLRRISAEYQVNDGGFWLMRLSQAIIGTVAVRRLPGNIAEVKRLNVGNEHRGRGLGGELLRHALAHAVANAYDTVRLDTIRNPGPALHLFEKSGFVEIPRYNDNPVADLFMELDLRNSETRSRYPPR